MSRLLIHVEGQTEETFVSELLSGHLLRHGWQAVSARLLGSGRERRKRGGTKSWLAVREEIARTLREDRGSSAALMVDYYALGHDWPGREAAERIVSSPGDPHEAASGLRGAHVQQALADDLIRVLGSAFRRERFAPYVAMHEFEALLFSDCLAMAEGMGQPESGDKFQEVRDRFKTPEDINDSPLTAPSKQIILIVPHYARAKPLLGSLAAISVGLEKMKIECPHFAAWLGKLENTASRKE